MQRPYKVFAERGPPSFLTHACMGGPHFDGLCGRLPPDGFSDVELEAEPTCSSCCEIIARLNGITSAWSSRRPTESDWYWFRDPMMREPMVVVRIEWRGQDSFGQRELRMYHPARGAWTPLDEWEGEWQRVKGPEP